MNSAIPSGTGSASCSKPPAVYIAAVSGVNYGWSDLENLAGSIEYAVWNCSLDLPVRLVAVYRLQTNVLNVPNRKEVQKNLDHIGNMIDLVHHMCSLELPVRLIALGEGAIQGFIDEIINMDQATYIDQMAADIPGPETEFLGEKAKEKNCYIIGQLKTRNPDFPDRFFNESKR